MKVLILVLSARRTPWNHMMDTSLVTWDAEDHPKTQTLYYCGKFESERPNTEKVFYSRQFNESLEEVTKRTLEAFEESLKLDWDVMARTHSSTYVHKRNLVEFIETLPKENVLAGLLTTGERPFLWGGGSYIISRDVIEKFVANKHLWNFNVMEDNGITEMAQALGIPFTAGRMASINLSTGGTWVVMKYGQGENFQFTDWADIRKAHPHFYFRCKHDPDRSVDLKVFRELHKHYH